MSEEVLAANTAHYTAFETGDLDLMGAIWVNGKLADHAWCVHPGWSPVRGRSAILRSYAAVMAGTTYIQFFLTDVEVALLGDTAVVTCTENMLSAGADMPETTFAGGRAVAMNVFARTGAGWRLLAHHASPVLTPEGDESD
jgi:ketosteroid isomerase-like protein